MYLFVLCLCVLCIVNVDSQKHFCADMNAQNSLDIEQLMGMWFGIEILSHKPNERGIVQYYDSCPVIYITEKKELTTTTPSTYEYGLTYGHGEHRYDHRGIAYTTRMSSTTTKRPSLYEQDEYSKRRYAAAASGYNPQGQPREQYRNLSLLWDESGLKVEYNLLFNPLRPGLWISSGPQNGSMLQKPYNQFAGTVQVMKAVGNHLVLTFCHRLPDKQLFSILLGREPFLNEIEITGVHNLLKRRDLLIGNIGKVCNNAHTYKNNIYSTIIILISILLKNIYS